MLQDVRMKRDALLETIAQNKAAHVTEYHEAMQGFAEQYNNRLQEMQRLASEHDRFETVVGLEVPTNHAEDYDRAEAMLKADVREEIVLDAMTFRQLVLDEWSWKEAWKLMKMSYTPHR